MLGAGLQSHHVSEECCSIFIYSLTLPFICKILSLLMSIINLADERLFLKSNFLCSHIFISAFGKSNPVPG